MEKKRKQHNFLQGAMILVIATGLVKLIGAVFKIPLGSLLSGGGMGYFSNAYDLYTPIYTIAMAGLPIAMSKIIAEYAAENRYKDIKNIFSISKKTFFVTGMVGFLLIALIAFPFTLLVKNPNSLYSILVIAPSMLFCCIMACYRGYYEGLRNMYPTGISQVIEALGKLVLGFLLAWLILSVGTNQFHTSGMVFGQIIDVAGKSASEIDAAVRAVILPFAAAGAIGGVTLGTIIGAIYLWIRNKFKNDDITEAELAGSLPARSSRENFRKLIFFAVPVVIGALALNIASIVDLVMVQFQLGSACKTSADAVIASHGTALSGLKPDEIPNFLYGCYKGFAYSFYNLVPTITSVLGVSAIPNLATAWAKRNKREIKVNIESVLRITSLIGLPAGIGISVLSFPILQSFYPKMPNEVAVAAPLLVLLAIAGALAGLAIPITSMLQAIGKQKIPVRNILIGTILKIIINAVLIGIPSINIMGAAISTVVCYAVILLLNIIALCKHGGMMPNFFGTMIKPLISAVLCGAAAWAGYGFIHRSVSSGLFSKTVVQLGLAVGIAFVVYAVTIILIKGISEDDVKMLPKGEKIAKVLAKLHLIG